jgi:NAD+ diphosphatase
MTRFFDGPAVADASSRTAFADNRIDRLSENREADAVATALADRTARFYLFRGGDTLLKPATPPDPLFTLDEARQYGFDAAEAILLGWTANGPRLTGTIAEERDIDSTVAPINQRALAVDGIVSTDHLGGLAQARALNNWHARHGFCSVCGTKSAIANGGLRRDCPACGAQHFPRTDPVVIMLAVHGERCLLGRQPHFAAGSYSCLAGFMEPGETIEDAVRRETAEEAGITIGRVRYHASQPWPFPSSLMIGCHAEALTTDIVRDETELEDCRWFDRDEARLMLAGTHPDVLKTPPPMAIANHIIRAWAEGD